MDPATAQMVKILMCWTVHLATAYNLPETLPELVYEPRAYHNAFAKNDIEFTTREYPVPEQGLLSLEIPSHWNVTYYEPADIKAPIIIFYPQEKPHNFQLTVSPLWDEGYFRNITELSYIKQYLESVGTDILQYSDQDELELKLLNGKQGNGYFFQVSDESAPDSEFKYLTQGALAVGELLVVFSYFSNQANDQNSDIILEMMRKAVHNHQRQVHLIY